MSDKNKKACTPISIGGQAVIEGVMMNGPEKMATAVRKSDGEIVIDIKEKNSFMSKYELNKIPILRGFLAFFVSMFTGVSCLMFSAKQCDLEEDGVEMSKFEKWVMEKFGDKIFDIIMYISVVISHRTFSGSAQAYRGMGEQAVRRYKRGAFHAYRGNYQTCYIFGIYNSNISNERYQTGF